MEYNGHRSWNAWNISLWVNNDETLYNYARHLVSEHGRKKAAKIMAKEMEGETTPDGGRYNYTCIYEAMEGIND